MIVPLLSAKETAASGILVHVLDWVARETMHLSEYIVFIWKIFLYLLIHIWKFTTV